MRKIDTVNDKLVMEGFHRTRAEINVLSIGLTGAGCTKGIYGTGFYMTRNLVDQIRNRMVTNYGPLLMQCEVNVTGFVCFDEVEATKVWGVKNKSLLKQLTTLHPGWKKQDLIYIKKMSDDLAKLWKRLRDKPVVIKNGPMVRRSTFGTTGQLTFTSEVAQSMCDRLKLQQYVPGVIYTGANDGACVVSFRSDRVKSVAYTYVSARIGGVSKKAGLVGRMKWTTLTKDSINRQMGPDAERTKTHVAMRDRIDRIMQSNSKKKVEKLELAVQLFARCKTARMRAVFIEVWSALLTEYPLLEKLNIKLGKMVTAADEEVLLYFGLRRAPRFDASGSEIELIDYMPDAMTISKLTKRLSRPTVLRKQGVVKTRKGYRSMPMLKMPTSLKKVLRAIQRAAMVANLKTFRSTLLKRVEMALSNASNLVMTQTKSKKAGDMRRQFNSTMKGLKALFGEPTYYPPYRNYPWTPNGAVARGKSKSLSRKKAPYWSNNFYNDFALGLESDGFKPNGSFGGGSNKFKGGLKFELKSLLMMTTTEMRGLVLAVFLQIGEQLKKLKVESVIGWWRRFGSKLKKALPQKYVKALA